MDNHQILVGRESLLKGLFSLLVDIIVIALPFHTWYEISKPSPTLEGSAAVFTLLIVCALLALIAAVMQIRLMLLHPRRIVLGQDSLWFSRAQKYTPNNIRQVARCPMLSQYFGGTKDVTISLTEIKELNYQRWVSTLRWEYGMFPKHTLQVTLTPEAYQRIFQQQPVAGSSLVVSLSKLNVNGAQFFKSLRDGIGKRSSTSLSPLYSDESALAEKIWEQRELITSMGISRADITSYIEQLRLCGITDPTVIQNNQQLFDEIQNNLHAYNQAIQRKELIALISSHVRALKTTGHNGY